MFYVNENSYFEEGVCIMNRSKSIQALIKKSKKDYSSLKDDYQASLQRKDISDELRASNKMKGFYRL